MAGTKKNKEEKLKPHVGALLLSEPFNPEPNFKRAVVLISQHDQRGSIGFILNKPTPLLINDVLEDFPEFKAQIHWGGNQRLDSVYYIHTISKLKGAQPISNGIFWGGDYEHLKLMVESKQINPEQIKFLAGYNAWSPRKLAKEIRNENWWVTNADLQSAFNEHPDTAWGNILQRNGHVYGILNDFPEDPGIN
ncbi:MAG: YqgE/AlgH family protein [Bacteroidota bacterium]